MNEDLLADQKKASPEQPQLRLIQDVQTRWNSFYLMLARIGQIFLSIGRDLGFSK
jgi:hypothetical protein